MPRRSWLLLAALALVIGSATPALAIPRCFGPYTLSSTNFAPDTTGDAVLDWWGDFSVNLAVTSGTLSVNVEGKLDGGGFASLGTMTSTSIAQFHGPLHRLRFNVTACSSCVATIVACAGPGE